MAVQYKARRDFIIDALEDEFHTQMSLGTSGAWRGCVVYTAFSKPKRTGVAEISEKFAGFGQTSKPLFSLVPPTSGMFLWLKIHFENVPGFEPGEEETLEMKLWTDIAEANVLIAPGRYFAAEEETVNPASGHFRISFSYASVRYFPHCTTCYN